MGISFSEYARHLAYFFNELLISQFWTAGLAAGAALALPAVALLLKDRVMLWAWGCFVVGVLPVAFIPQRNLDSIYIPLGALAIYCGQCTYRLIPNRMSWVWFAVLIVLLVRVYGAPLTTGGWEKEYGAIREAREYLARALPSIPPGTRLYCKNEPHPDMFAWWSYFLVQLQRRDESIVVDNALRDPKADLAQYDWILDWHKETNTWTMERGHK